jgi:hypothetical protein
VGTATTRAGGTSAFWNLSPFFAPEITIMGFGGDVTMPVLSVGEELEQ